MDSLAFPLVRLTSRLFHATLSRQLQDSRERLSGMVVKNINRHALCDNVPHADLLTIFMHRLHAMLISADSGGGEVRDVLVAARPILQAIQRYPQQCNHLKKEAEELVIQLLLRTPTEEVSSAECTILWTALTQCSEWTSVEALLGRFPLLDTLTLQSNDEFQTIVDAVCASTHMCTTGGYSVFHSKRLLKEVLGEDDTWRRCAAALGDGVASNTYRFEKRVPTCVTLSSVLGRWDAVDTDSTEHNHLQVLSEERWSQLAPAHHMLSSMHVPEFHSLSQLLTALHQDCVPVFVRTTIRPALVSDFWRLYTELLPESVAMFFQDRLQELMTENKVMPLQEIWRNYHEEALHAQLQSTTAPPLLREVLLNLFVSSAALQCNAELLQAIATTLTHQMEKLIPDGIQSALLSRETELAANLKAGVNCSVEPNGSDQSRAVDRVWQLWSPLYSAYLTVAAEDVFFSTSEHLQVFASTPSGVELKKRMMAVLRVLLAEPVLAHRGSARLVWLLLLRAPHFTSELGVESICFTLLHRCMRDGFSRKQLISLVSTRGSNCAPSHGWSFLPPELEAQVRATIEELPQR